MVNFIFISFNFNENNLKDFNNFVRQSKYCFKLNYIRLLIENILNFLLIKQWILKS